jgi:hypothetical protein
VTSKIALQLVSGSSVTVADTVPLLMKNSSGFFGRLGKPVTRALPSLFVPTSTCVLRLFKNPYLIVRLTLASKMGLPAPSHGEIRAAGAEAGVNHGNFRRVRSEGSAERNENEDRA